MPDDHAPRTGRVPNEERLFNLVLALLDAERGLRKAELFARVRGYQERFADTGTTDALDKQFDRDKGLLRDLGIPLETIDDPDHPGDGRFSRYRIPRSRLELPESVRFTADELGLLMLAAQTWSEGALAGPAGRAAMKLRALGVPGTEALVGYAPRIRVRDTAFAPLQQALDRGQAVSFDYFTPGTAGPRTRRVDPIALVEHEGRWHLHGRDRDADAERTYLLSRISGEVAPLRGVVAPPAPEGAGARVAARLRELHAAQTARIRVAAGSEAALRLGRRAAERTAAEHGDELVVHYTDRLVFADELTGYGPEVVVLEPAELGALVAERLRLVAAEHRDAAPAPGAPAAAGASGTDEPAPEGGR